MVSKAIRHLSLMLIASICLGEFLIMMLLSFFKGLSFYWVALIDVALLSCITVPVVIWNVTRPMIQHSLALKQSNRKISQRETQMLSALKSLALARDNETGQHIQRTQRYVRLLCERLIKMGQYSSRMNSDFMNMLVKAAPLHDVGKVGIPDSILNKNGPLTDSELEVMRTHANIGETILLAAMEGEEGGDLIAIAGNVAGGHHEKWDGSGYPRKLHGQDIPLEARVMSLADVYDALVSKRVYKEAWDFEGACQEIIHQRGKSFDPVIVDAFLAERKNFEKIALKYKDEH